MKKTLFLMFLVAAASAGCNRSGRHDNWPFRADNPPAADSAKASIPELVPEAIKIVRQGLRDKNTLARMDAVDIVASSNRVDLMPMVVNLLNDESAPVRFEAALALGDAKYHVATNSLKQLLDDENENVRLAAAYTLTRLAQQDYSNRISQAITSKDQTVRANAALLLGKLGDKKALNRLDWVMHDSASDDTAVYQAAKSRAMLGDEKIFPRLWTLLISKFLDDRLDGVRAMAELRTLGARNALLTMLYDNEPEVRLFAAERLGMLGDPSGELEVLIFLNKHQPEADKKVENRRSVLAAMAIGRIGTPALIKSLPGLLKSDSKEVRLAAAQSVLILSK